MIRVGIAGIGFMGWIHYLAYRRCDETEVGAICSRSPKKLAGDWRDIQGNFGPPGEQIDTSALAAYAQLDDLLADDPIDVVDLCLPPHLHADAAVAALEHGKHVFCEKPMALTTDECQRMVAAARANDRQLFIGHVHEIVTDLYYKVPEQVPLKSAALLVMAAIAHLGCGLVGLLALTLARLSGVRRVIAIDLDEFRLEKAKVW